MKLSAIILAKTTTHESYKITMNCIDSLMNSEINLNLEIIIIESNKDFYSSNIKYPNIVKIVIPINTFNFHKFLNIGIKEALGDYLGLFNNDLIFHKNWFSEIIKASNQNNKILSFSPFGTILTENKKDKYDTGYKVGTHINGWCLVVKKQLFSIIDFNKITIVLISRYYASSSNAKQTIRQLKASNTYKGGKLVKKILRKIGMIKPFRYLLLKIEKWNVKINKNK